MTKHLTRHAFPQGLDFTAVNLKIKKMQKSSAQCGLKDHLTQLENTLSALENREPRDFDLPAPPSMMLREMRHYPK